jgi:hypothetical protein
MQNEQYLLAAFDPQDQDRLLSEIIQNLTQRTDCSIVSVVTNTTTKRVVARLSPQAVKDLKAGFGQRLLVEVDAELRL